MEKVGKTVARVQRGTVKSQAVHSEHVRNPTLGTVHIHAALSHNRNSNF